MSEDLIIKISADSSEVAEKLSEIGSDAEGMEGKLGDAAKISGVAFAALAVQVGVSLKAYADHELQANRLTAALQSQGIYTDDLVKSYNDQADTVSRLTGYEKDQITAAQTIAQSYLGQMPITEDLTKAIADLAAKQGIDLPSAARILGQEIGNGTGQLKRQGLAFAATDTEADRYQKTLEFVSVKAGGMAEAANSGLGSIKGLENAFHEAQVELGERFAPAATFIIKALTDFLTPAKDASGTLTDLKAAFIAVGLVVSGLGVALPALIVGFNAVRTAMIALEISAGPVGLIILAVAALTAAVVYMGLHWEEVSARVSAIVTGLVTFVSGAFKGLSGVLQGAMHLNADEIAAGFAQIEDAFADGSKAAFATIPEELEKSLDEQDQIQKKYADKAAAAKRAAEALKKKQDTLQNDVAKLTAENGSKAMLKLKQEELAAIKELEKEQTPALKAILTARVNQLEGLIAQQQTNEISQDASFKAAMMQGQQQYDSQFKSYIDSQNAEKMAGQQQSDSQLKNYTVTLNAEEIATLKAKVLTKQDIEKQFLEADITQNIDSSNQRLKDEQQFGTAYAAINQGMHNSILQQSEKGLGDLSAMQNSNNVVLKDIGKAASIAQITIKTAESAMNVFAGFSVIPFIGPALGIAAAAAVIAYGGEQIGNVLAAQTGGMVPGSGYGDRIPALLEPGELITPRQNFNEVVNSVAASRTGQSPGNGTVSGNVGIKVGFNGPQASRVITVTQNEDKSLGISRAKT